MGNRKNLLVTLADKKYIQQAKQLFSSVYWNAGWQGDYMLLSHEIPEEDLRWFRDKGILVWQCQPLYKESVTYVFSPVVLDKFYLFTEEFKKWKLVVYLDSDIIVKGSLERLTKIKYFGAIRDVFIKSLDSQFFDASKNQLNNITYNFRRPAFNSGVFSFNTDIITPYTFSQLNTLFTDHFSSFRYLDQATLNLYFYKKWKKLPYIYNVIVDFTNFKLPAKFKFIIIHFVTSPDHPPLWNSKNSYYHEWKTNLEKAENIDLCKIQKARKWNKFKISYYSIILDIYLFKYIGKSRLKKIFYYNELRTFYIYKLPNIVYVPDRLMGKIGSCLKKISPGLYDKLKRIKDG